MGEGFYFSGAGGKNIYTHCWDEAANPKAVVQIFHGMAEHAARYENFAIFLNRNGFIVYADDHRGHSKTAGMLEEVGYIGEDGFNEIVQDEYILMGIIKNKHPGLSVVILGHSFGSFVAQEYITRYGNEITGAILSGSAYNKGWNVVLARAITAIQMKLFSERRKARLITLLAFGKFNNRIKNPISPCAWLSRDDTEVKKYDSDSYCGTIFTINFFYYFFDGLSKLYESKKISKIPNKLPLFICSGDEDPVGAYGKSVRKLYNFYKEKGKEKVQLKLYPGGRHEIINEINREEVFYDISKWIIQILKIDI